jgi:hypothetical protein
VSPSRFPFATCKRGCWICLPPPAPGGTPHLIKPGSALLSRLRRGGRKTELVCSQRQLRSRCCPSTGTGRSRGRPDLGPSQVRVSSPTHRRAVACSVRGLESNLGPFHPLRLLCLSNRFRLQRSWTSPTRSGGRGTSARSSWPRSSPPCASSCSRSRPATGRLPAR